MMVFISSTIEDLIKDRDALGNSIKDFSERTGFSITPQRFERWVSSSKPGYDPMTICLNKLKNCNYCIFLLGGIYGDNPPRGRYNPKNLSATELEYDLAVQNPNITRIVFEKQRKKRKGDKKYERFREKIKEKDQIIPFKKTREIPVLFLSVLMDNLKYTQSLQREIIEIYSQQLDTMLRTTDDIITETDQTRLESDKIKIVIQRIHELKRARELDIYSKNEKGSKLSNIRYLRREGHLASAKRLANELIVGLWPECKSKKVSTMHGLKDVDLNLLCYAILEKGLIFRYSLDLKKSLDYLKICYEMCEDTKIDIQYRIKQRVVDVIAGAYFYLGDIEKAEELVNRAETLLEMLKSSGDFEPGAESELALFKAELKAVKQDEDAIIELDHVRKIKEKERNLLSIVVCDIDKAMYYYSINKDREAKMIIDDIKKSKLNFIFEMDTFVNELWELAKKGSTFDGMFKKFNRDTSIPD